MSHQLFKRVFYSLDGTSENRVFTTFVKLRAWCRRARLSSPIAGASAIFLRANIGAGRPSENWNSVQLVRTLRSDRRRREKTVGPTVDLGRIRTTEVTTRTKTVCCPSAPWGGRNASA